MPHEVAGDCLLARPEAELRFSLLVVLIGPHRLLVRSSGTVAPKPPVSFKN
jgi:hypothetical protein